MFISPVTFESEPVNKEMLKGVMEKKHKGAAIEYISRFRHHMHRTP